MGKQDKLNTDHMCNMEYSNLNKIEVEPMRAQQDKDRALGRWSNCQKLTTLPIFFHITERGTCYINASFLRVQGFFFLSTCLYSR